MVLLGVIVLALASQVIATPHGYGVKGGAVAKAEASASAGAFSGLPPIPLAIPSGPGYSGSFSKSSSSSFASSSASASSSSSSFSFSGNGANAINGFGVNGGCSSGPCQNNGCSSGTCQNNGANGEQGKYGNSANAAAAAGATAFVSSPCVGENCNAKDNKECASGQCGNNKPSNSDCTNGDCSSTDKKPDSGTNCKSGNCGQENTQTTYEETSPNDLKVNIPGKSPSNNNYNLPSQSAYPEETIKNGATSPCGNGICKPGSQSLSPSNSYGGTNLGYTLQPNKGFNSISPSNNNQKPSGYDKPSTLEPECTTHDCVSPSQNIGNDGENRPTSYDVPIFGTTLPSNYPDKKESCTSPDCQNNDVKNSFPNNNVNSFSPSYNDLPVSKSPNECNGGICTSQTVAPPKIGSSKPFTPYYSVQPVEQPVPSTGYSGCTGPNCGSSVFPNVGVYTNQPNYNTLGNCGPSGCGNIAQTGTTIPKNPHGYESIGKSTPSGQNYFYSTGQPDCKGASCGTPGFPNVGANTNQPTINSPGSCGTLGCGNTPQSGGTFNHNQPGYENIGKVTPSGEPSLAPSKNSECKGQNCGTPSFPSIGTHTNQPAFNIPGNCGSSGCIPQTGPTTYNQQGYGGIGVSTTTLAQGSQTLSPSWATQSTPSPLKPGGYTNPFLTQSYKPNPSIVSPNTELAPPNENSGLGVHSKPFELSKPNKLNTNQNNQLYTGGFGGSNGDFNTNAVIKPHSEPTVSPSTVATTHPSSLPSTPQYSQNTKIPSTPSNENSGLGVNSKPFDSSKPNKWNTNKNTQVYTGGFGGSNGDFDTNAVIKPHSGPTVSPGTVAATNPSNLPSTPQYSQNTNIPSTPSNENSGLGVNSKPFDSSKPNKLNTNQNTQVYTGGFGGSNGDFDTNAVIKPHSGPTVSPGTVAATNPSNLPSTPLNDNSGLGVHSKPFDLSAPGTNTQSYTDGFGGSKGTIDEKPLSNPHSGPTVSPGTVPAPNPSNLPTTPQYRPPNSVYSSHSPIPIQGSPAVPVPQSSGTKDSSYHKGTPYTGGFNGPSGFLKLNDYSIPSKILSPNQAAPCASNNCGSQVGHATSLASAVHNSIANANAHAVASAIAYSGGFGGPPGFLKPFDDGKNTGPSAYNGKPSSSLQGVQGSSSYISSGYNNNKQAEKGIHESGTGSLFNHAGAVAQANSVATSSAGAYSGSNGGGVKGCSLGCVPANGNGAEGLDALGNGINAGAIASAKSVAGAGSFGIGGSYSSSSASAHASAGAATKGGYGRR